ncbi:glycosyltransferase family protein [Mucilaginibacter segetis]|uniref:GT2 family glycosyltransferase n=1 Tax=Mucilaginibacter segetis TaxID=2793071 RepID=A0A934UNU1_9SPHI|nr:hypothetical protein [Mucilaginibacter segetis]MBK0381143.1 hypothetical protein [Mucilaginibacter segetis]
MEDLLAVLVLYNMPLAKSATFLSINASLKKSTQSLQMVVYDNTPVCNADFEEGQSYSIDNISITYIPDENNSGVSRAYNVANNIALQTGKKWLLLLDQDTDFPEHTIPAYANAISSYPEGVLFAPIMVVNHHTIISPCKFRYMRGFSLDHISPGIHNLKNLSVINCGMCISTLAFKKNKGYNEGIKLDFSDHDFIKRFHNTVTDSFIVIDLQVTHELSTEKKNTTGADLIRFNYYLQGMRNMSASVGERFILNLNAFIRALKLSVIHVNLNFILKLFTGK